MGFTSLENRAKTRRVETADQEGTLLRYQEVDVKSLEFENMQLFVPFGCLDMIQLLNETRKI